MSHAISTVARSKSRMNRTKSCKPPMALIFTLAAFVVIALMQAFELRLMLSEARSIAKDIDGMRAGQEILLEQHSFYNNNLSYYLNNC